MTKLLDNICFLRDILTEKDYKKILFNINKFRQVYQDVNRNIERFIKSDTHTLDFNSQDLIDLSIEVKTVLSALNQRISASKMIKQITAPEKITDATVKEFTMKYADYFTMIAVLTECHNIICYAASLLNVLELQYNQGELDYVVIQAIKNALR